MSSAVQIHHAVKYVWTHQEPQQGPHTEKALFFFSVVSWCFYKLCHLIAKVSSCSQLIWRWWLTHSFHMHGANDAMWLQSPYLCFHHVKWSAAAQSSVVPRDMAFFFSRWKPKRRQSRLKFLDDLYFLVTQQPAGWFVKSPVSVCLNSQIKLWVAFF